MSKSYKCPNCSTTHTGSFSRHAYVCNNCGSLVIVDDPENKELCDALTDAYSLLRNGKFKQAILSLDTAFEINPNEPAVHIGKLMVNAKIKKFQDLKHSTTPLHDNDEYYKAIDLSESGDGISAALKQYDALIVESIAKKAEEEKQKELQREKERLQRRKEKQISRGNRHFPKKKLLIALLVIVAIVLCVIVVVNVVNSTPSTPQEEASVQSPLTGKWIARNTAYDVEQGKFVNLEYIIYENGVGVELCYNEMYGKTLYRISSLVCKENGGNITNVFFGEPYYFIVDGDDDPTVREIRLRGDRFTMTLDDISYSCIGGSSDLEFIRVSDIPGDVPKIGDPY